MICSDLGMHLVHFASHVPSESLSLSLSLSEVLEITAVPVPGGILPPLGRF